MPCGKKRKNHVDSHNKFQKQVFIFDEMLTNNLRL